jgi:predicted alpha/beta-hydrolase family hydrolase
MTDSVMTEVATAHGPARFDLAHPATTPLSLLVLGHGAGGGVDAVDLRAVRDAAVPAGVAVARVLQPYRVAGRRAPAPAGQLDRAFSDVVTAVLREVPAADLGAVGVLALAFPLHPPGKPDRSRAGELPDKVPTLVVNGDRDPFGVPDRRGPVEVRVLAGETHDLRRNPKAMAKIVVDWLVQHGWAS